MEEDKVVDRDFESEAKAQGWKPEEEYAGDPSKWVDAETFVKRGENYVGILKDRFERLERKYKEIETVAEDLKTINRKQAEADKKKIAELVRQLEEKREAAITNGDGKTFTKIDRQLEEAKQEQRQLEANKAPGPNDPPPPEVQQWISENTWYGQDDDATAVADRYATRLREAQPFLKGREFMDKVAEYVKTKFPDKFENPRKRKSPDVELDHDPKGGGQVAEDTGYKSLPRDAKDQFNRLVRQKLFKDSPEDRQRFAELYHS